MIQFAPHLLAVVGVWLLVIATVLKITGLFNGVMFRVIPSILGSISLWMSAALFMTGGAS